MIRRSEIVAGVRELRKEYSIRQVGGRGRDQLVAVDDVSFELPAQGSLAIVGESGSGKTTIARILVGLEVPSDGTITVGGRQRRPGSRMRWDERKRWAREIQLVFQDPYGSLDPRQTIGDCLDEALRLHFDMDGGARRHRVDELLELVGLSVRRRGDRPRVLSGGQRQRVAIARALAVRPMILVLDEAVAALDVSIQAQVLNLLADIRRETGIAYLFISHDLAVVRQVSEEVIVMRSGRIVERGPTEAVLDHPADSYTQLLRDSVPRPGWRPERRDSSTNALPAR